MSVEKLLRFIIQPSDSIQSASMRRQAWFLSALLAVLFLFFAGGVFLARRPPAPYNAGRIVMGCSAALILAAYFLSRTRFYRAAALVAVGVLIAVTTAMYLIGSDYSADQPLYSFIWLVLPVFLASVFLDTAALAMVSAAGVAAMAAMFAFVPRAGVVDLAYAMLFIATYSGLTLITSRYRLRLEKEHTAELQFSLEMKSVELRRRQALEESLWRNSERTAILHDLEREVLLEEKSLEEIASGAFKRLGPLMGCAGVSAFILDAERRSARPLADSFEPEDRAGAGGDWLPLAEIGEGQRVIQALEADRRPLVLDRTKLRHEAPWLVRTARVHDFLFVGMDARGELIGLVCFGKSGAKEFSAGHVESAVQAARSLGIAVRNFNMREQIRTHTASLERSLQEKEALLKEVHHRVKNNLQIISSLLYLQAKKSDLPASRDFYREVQDRVQSIVFVHERLYRSADLALIKFESYAGDIVRNLSNSYGIDPAVVRCEIEGGEVEIEVDVAVPMGLIITELVSNSFKYAFPDGARGAIRVRLEESAGRPRRLTVCDDGIGLPAGFDQKNNRSMGLRIIETLARQIHAVFTLESPGRGVVCTFEFTAG